MEISLKKESNGKEEYSVAVFRRLADFSGEKLKEVKAYAATFKEQIKLMLEQRAENNAEQFEDVVCVVGDELPMTKSGDSGLPLAIDGERETLPG